MLVKLRTTNLVSLQGTWKLLSLSRYFYSGFTLSRCISLAVGVMVWVLSYLLFGAALVNVTESAATNSRYLNEFVVEVKGGTSQARQVAEELGFTYVMQVNISLLSL